MRPHGQHRAAVLVGSRLQVADASAVQFLQMAFQGAAALAQAVRQIEAVEGQPAADAFRLQVDVGVELERTVAEFPERPLAFRPGA